VRKKKQLDSRNCFDIILACDRQTHDDSIYAYRASIAKVKVKFFRPRYQALGLELIPVYRQSARRCL